MSTLATPILSIEKRLGVRRVDLDALSTIGQLASRHALIGEKAT
jgi:hypothetical protein